MLLKFEIVARVYVFWGCGINFVGSFVDELIYDALS